jgi:hypothetical protein
MLVKLIFTVAIVVALLYGLRWFQRTPSAQVAKTLRGGVLALVAVVLVFLVATGRLHWLFGFIAAALPFLQRALALLRTYRNVKSTWSQAAGLGRGNAQGSGAANTAAQTSSIRTQHLHMSLDHATGALDGKVLTGRFHGSQLAELDLEALLELLAECEASDNDSAMLLQTYLDRRFGPQWQQHRTATSGAGSRAGGSGSMTREEAYEILGLKPGAAADAIRDAHRRLMLKLHPDRGGSNYLAAKINQAKDLLLE